MQLGSEVHSSETSSYVGGSGLSTINQDALPRSASKDPKESTFERQVAFIDKNQLNKFINRTSDYVEYLRNENYFYLSSSLKIGADLVEGQLFKKSNSKLHQFVKNEKVFLRRYVRMDFQEMRVAF